MNRCQTTDLLYIRLFFYCIQDTLFIYFLYFVCIFYIYLLCCLDAVNKSPCEIGIMDIFYFSGFTFKNLIMGSRNRITLVLLRQICFGGAYLYSILHIAVLCFTLQIDFSKGKIPFWKFENLFKK